MKKTLNIKVLKSILYMYNCKAKEKIKIFVEIPKKSCVTIHWTGPTCFHILGFAQVFGWLK